MTGDGARVLVTDRPPGAWRSVTLESLVAPVGAGGVYDSALADRWSAAGWSVAAGRSRVDAVDGAAVRDVFDVEPADEALSWIRLQREAVLADEWRWMLAWLPTALERAVVDVDVGPERLGAVEEAVRLGGATLGAVRGRTPGPFHRGGIGFWAGEVAFKGLRSPRPSVEDADVLFYAECENHWRQCAPIAAELAARGVSVAFMPAAIGRDLAFVPPGLDTVAGLDARALRGGTLRDLVRSSRKRGSRPVVRGRVSVAAMAALSARAEHARLVYEKARCVGRHVSARVCVFGDASAHRPAGLAAGLREAGIPSIAVQHGAIIDVRRYVQATDVFLVWDDASVRTLAGEPGGARTVVTGPAGVEAEALRAVGRATVPGSVLIAPSNVSERLLADWIDSARRLALDAGASPVRVRLHPRTPRAVRERMSARFPEIDDAGGSLVEALRACAVVLHDGSSVGVEAGLLGVPEVDASSPGAAAAVLAALALPVERASAAATVDGAVSRAADAVLGVLDA